jgi:hypothetical protein
MKIKKNSVVNRNKIKSDMNITSKKMKKYEIWKGGLLAIREEFLLKMNKDRLSKKEYERKLNEYEKKIKYYSEENKKIEKDEFQTPEVNSKETK